MIFRKARRKYKTFTDTYVFIFVDNGSRNVTETSDITFFQKVILFPVIKKKKTIWNRHNQSFDYIYKVPGVELNNGTECV